MTSMKTLAVATLLGLGVVGSASAQVMPGSSGSPGRGNSSPVAIMENGGVVSNGYQAEPRQIIRGEIVADQVEMQRRQGLPLTAPAPRY